jgi:hypothetical protein
MRPEVFTAEVLPLVVQAWERRCFCSAPGFQKLMSFDFSRYGSTPVALYDLEAIGTELIEKRFKKLSEPTRDPRSGKNRHSRECPQCATRCDVVWEQYSINFDCTYYEWNLPRPVVPGTYLVGFYGFQGNWLFPDYREGTREQFFDAIGAG